MRRYLGIFCFMVILSSCRKEEDTTWTSSWAAPLAHGRITLSDIIPSEYGYVDGNGLWHLRIQKELSALATIFALRGRPKAAYLKLVNTGLAPPGPT